MTKVAQETRICLGLVLGAHGVSGALRIRPYTEQPAAIAAYGPLEDESGERRFSLRIEAVRRGAVIAKVQGIAGREAAEALKGTRLYVRRRALPEPAENEYYPADLVGLRVELADGRRLGRVRAIVNYGAGDIVEIEPEGGGETLLLPFTQAQFPVVDLESGRLIAASEPDDIEKE